MSAEQEGQVVRDTRTRRELLGGMAALGLGVAVGIQGRQLFFRDAELNVPPSTEHLLAGKGTLLISEGIYDDKVLTAFDLSTHKTKSILEVDGSSAFDVVTSPDNKIAAVTVLTDDTEDDSRILNAYKIDIDTGKLSHIYSDEMK